MFCCVHGLDSNQDAYCKDPCDVERDTEVKNLADMVQVAKLASRTTIKASNSVKLRYGDAVDGHFVSVETSLHVWLLAISHN